MNYSKAAQVRDLMLAPASYIMSGNSCYRLCFASEGALSSSQCFNLEALGTFLAKTLKSCRETQFHSTVRACLYRLLSSHDRPPLLPSGAHCSGHLLKLVYFASIIAQHPSILTAVTSSARYLSSETQHFASALVCRLPQSLHVDENRCLHCSQNFSHLVTYLITIDSLGPPERQFHLDLGLRQASRLIRPWAKCRARLSDQDS